VRSPSPSNFSAFQELFSAGYPASLSFLGRWIAPGAKYFGEKVGCPKIFLLSSKY